MVVSLPSSNVTYTAAITPTCSHSQDFRQGLQELNDRHLAARTKAVKGDSMTVWVLLSLVVNIPQSIEGLQL